MPRSIFNNPFDSFFQGSHILDQILISSYGLPSASATMGRHRRGKYRAQNEEASWENEAPWQDHHRQNHQTDERLRFQSPKARVGNSDNFNNSNPFQRIQYPRKPLWNHSINHHLNPLQVPRRFDHAFITKSKRLKDYLVLSLNQALNQIEQWYPETPSDDEMDWQHEEEIVVTQPQEVCYIWDFACSGGESPRNEESGQGGVPRLVSFVNATGGGNWGPGAGENLGRSTLGGKGFHALVDSRIA